MTPRKGLVLGMALGTVGVLILILVICTTTLVINGEKPWTNQSEIIMSVVVALALSLIFGSLIGWVLVVDKILYVPPDHLVWKDGQVLTSTKEKTLRLWKKDPAAQGEIISYKLQEKEIIISGPTVTLTEKTSRTFRYKVNIEKGGTVESFSQYKTWEEDKQQPAQDLISQALYAIDNAEPDCLANFTNPADKDQQIKFNNRIQKIVNPIIKDRGIEFIEAKFYFA